MSRKLYELRASIGAGARTNKYRVHFPYLGKNLDIQCHNVQSPGRSIGTVDVYLKGREFKIAGDRADEGSITLTFYNDPELLLRRFFLKIIGGIQNYQTPVSIAVVDASYSEQLNSILGTISSTISDITNAYNQIKYNINGLMYSSGLYYGTYDGKPWYQTDIKILQLGPDEETLVETVLHNAFVSDVSALEYTDETGEISQTTLTITYSGISYGNDKEIRYLEKY